jgi:hypothetical protein
MISLTFNKDFKKSTITPKLFIKNKKYFIFWLFLRAFKAKFEDGMKIATPLKLPSKG